MNTIREPDATFINPQLTINGFALHTRQPDGSYNVQFSDRDVLTVTMGSIVLGKRNLLAPKFTFADVIAVSPCIQIGSVNHPSILRNVGNSENDRADPVHVTYLSIAGSSDDKTDYKPQMQRLYEQLTLSQFGAVRCYTDLNIKRVPIGVKTKPERDAWAGIPHLNVSYDDYYLHYSSVQ